MNLRDIESAIAERPDDAELYVVYGDMLQALGNPRGELIALMQRLEAAPARYPQLAPKVRALLERHKDELLGGLAAPRELRLSWRHGFIRSARWAPSTMNGWQRSEPVATIATLLASPSARFLQRLVVFARHELREPLRAVVDAHKPATLREVALPPRTESLEHAAAQKEPVLWIELSTDAASLSHDLFRFRDVERLALHAWQLRRLPTRFAELRRLSELYLDQCPMLEDLAEEVVGIETLERVSFRGATFRSMELVQLTEGLTERRAPRQRRIVEYALFRGDRGRADELASDDDLLAALDSNVARARFAALELLRSRRSDALYVHPIKRGSRLSLLGAPSVDRAWLAAQLAARGAEMQDDDVPTPTHALICERPGGAQLELGAGVVLVFEPDLVAALAGDERAARLAAPTEQPRVGDEPLPPSDLARRLRSREVADVERGLAELARRGVPEHLLAELLVLCQDVELAPATRKSAKKLFAQYAPPALQLAVREQLKTPLLGDAGETKISERLAALARAAPVIDGLHLARLLLARGGRGLRYVFEHGDPAQRLEALRAMRSGDTLDLANRELVDLPAELARLPSLRRLSLHHGHLERLPAVVLELAELQALDLSGNRLRDLPADFARLSRLRSLTLSDNRFARVPGAATALPDLERFELVSGGFGGRRARGLPDDIGALQELRILIYCNNVIEALPQSLFELRRLEVLDLHGCQLPEEIPEALSQLSSLRELDVSDSGWDTLAGIATLRELLPRCHVGERFG